MAGLNGLTSSALYACDVVSARAVMPMIREAPMAYPRDFLRRRPGLDLGIDIGRHDGNGVVAVAEDLPGAELLGKVPQRWGFDLPETVFRMGRVR